MHKCEGCYLCRIKPDKCYACDIKLNKKTRAFMIWGENKYYCKKCFKGMYPDLWI